MFHSLTMFEHWLESEDMKGALSKVYKLLMTQEKVVHLIRKVWEIDVGLQLTEEQLRLINICTKGILQYCLTGAFL